MEKIVKIVCVCAVLLVGGLGARFTEAKALAGAKHAAPSIIELLWEVEDWREVKDRLSGWLRQAYSWISPSGAHLFLPNDVYLYQISDSIISISGQGCAIACTNSTELLPASPLFLETPYEKMLKTLQDNLAGPLPQAQVLAEQSTDMRFPAQLVDDPYAFEMKKAPGFQRNWLAQEEATLDRGQGSNECGHNKSLEETLDIAREIYSAEHPSKQDLSDLSDFLYNYKGLMNRK